jgi:type II secretory pathway pseudopilin PulG
VRFGHALARSRVGDCKSPAHGSILLEVILALALFVTAAAIVTSGMNASADSLERQRLNTHAGNLAATVLAEIQLGIRSPAAGGEQPFLAPFDKWTAELVVSPTETETGAASGLLRVEVIIRHQEAQLVRRLSQVVRVDPNRSAVPAAF